MANPAARHATEAEARAIAEASREKKWDKPSFMREMFLGNLRMDWIYPFPNHDLPERPEYAEFVARMKDYLLNEVDPLEIDATGEFPENIVERLSELGALGMNLPKEYGGQGFTKAEYCRTMVMSSGYEGSLMGFLSPHQSVGVPECLKLFGTMEQKEKYLPLCASGHVSAFALTETDVGSDPARVSTTLEETPDGKAYLLNGTKLWCTNGTMAKLLVVMARHKESGKISAVVVETAWEGVKVDHRCRFMGLSALANGVLSFTNVRVPRENMIAKEGAGLRIALTALNTGRLSIPYGAVGGAKKALEVARTWAKERVQWGKPIGQHEAIAHKLSHMAGKVLAMESIAEFACQLADQGKYDIRLEAAAAKEYNTCRAWEIIDDTMQIRGGRGYEKETSLLARGERAMPVERLMRDGRVSKIFEGASEIMHLLMAREAVDKHLSVAGDLIDPKVPFGKKLAVLPKAAGFYLTWYPSRYIGPKGWFGYGEFGNLAPHVRFVERSARKLARQAFHAMAVYGPKLERKQAFLFRWVDIAMELFAISVVAARVQTMKDHKSAEAESAAELADLFCRNARRRVTQLFRDLWYNDDDLNYDVAQGVMDQRYAWLERGIITMDEADAARAARQSADAALRGAAGVYEAAGR
ncbi:MAG: acyl-CoA dehydrogenase family protein [Candidatus Hydrogenedentes bacterium]|nr:acyl-CoA dehydrogenase family protein [Candidatus Hydrogenedentota bacterium]